MFLARTTAASVRKGFNDFINRLPSTNAPRMIDTEPLDLISKKFGEFDKGNRLSLIADKASRSLVARLFFHGGPSAVFLEVRQFIVDAIKAHSLRARPHIGQECSERIAPFIAYGYSAPAIIAILRTVTVLASRLHRHPRPIFSGVNLSVFQLETPAAFSVSANQAGAVKSGSFSAVAFADVEAMSRADRAWIKMKHQEHSKSLPGNVYNLSSHAVPPSKEWCWSGLPESSNSPVGRFILARGIA